MRGRLMVRRTVECADFVRPAFDASAAAHPDASASSGRPMARTPFGPKREPPWSPRRVAMLRLAHTGGSGSDRRTRERG